MTMHKRRSLFVTGILLSALVLFGFTTASAQVTAVDVNSVTAAALDHDSIRLRWVLETEDSDQIDNITAFEIRFQEGDDHRLSAPSAKAPKSVRVERRHHRRGLRCGSKG